MEAFLASNQFLLELVVKGTLLMTLAFAVTFLLRKKSAALRHAVWSLAFVGLLLLPVGAAFLPSWYVPLPDLVQNETAAPERIASSRRTADLPSSPLTPTTEITQSEAHETPSPTRSWAGAAILLWIGGAIVFLMRMAIVLNKLSLVRRSAIPVTDREWTTLAEILPEILGVRREVVLLQHEEVHVPMTYGVRRPVVLLPIQTDNWSEDQKRITLMHELLHVRRFDYIVHMLALSARALHWFNPLAWMAAKRLVVERERACDDGVLEMGVASTSYADHLLDVARFVLSGNEASTAALAMARSSELRSRVVAILNPIQPRRGLTPMRIISMTTSALVIVVLVAAVQPGRQAPKKNSIQVLLPSVTETAGSIGNSIRNLAAIITKDSIGTPQVSVEEELSDTEVSDTSKLEAQRRAIHAISELPEERSIPLLRDIAETHTNQQLREEAIFWLGQVGNGSVAELLEKFARNDVSEEVQKKAVFALSELEDELGVPHLLNLAEANLSEEVRQEVVFWLGEAGGARVADDLEAFARNDASEAVQRKALFALAQIEDGAGLDRLVELARTHPNPDIQAEAVFWMGEAGGTEVAKTLADFARNGKTRDIQKKALFALSDVDDNAGVPYLIELARSHPDQEVRGEAIFWLGETDDPRAADILMEIVNGK